MGQTKSEILPSQVPCTCVCGCKLMMSTRGGLLVQECIPCNTFDWHIDSKTPIEGDDEERKFLERYS